MVQVYVLTFLYLLKGIYPMPHFKTVSYSLQHHQTWLCPEILRDCTLQIIPKPGKDPTVSDSYRPIALCPTLSKVLQWCILLTYGNAFSTSSLQFGFKPGMSANMCTGLVKNVISRYCFNGSNVFGCFLDASKAFDRVCHLKLFNKLLERNLPPTVIRLLFFLVQ